ncbi:heterokaryon incompatibility protein [Rutstroemia sp. NJR-2017a WRK4]|nr:heterokaryon incompatibility protein [Rutstroemia sp. NJR-2017a WRK4]
MYFEPSHSPNPNPKYTVESMSKELIDWNRYKHEIEESVIKYDTKSELPIVLPEGFRVIDVERDKVVLAPENCQYVALSYVWGEMTRTSALMLRKGNVQQLAEDFSIPRSNLPATIRDAMVVCAKIGKRYLWVDCLCIVQDGHEDVKQAQIENMGNIYASATLTIVGASGDDARSGLAGIDGKPRLKAPRLIHLNKMVLTESVESPFYSNDEAIPKWHTRGWTFQELLFSSRLLIFTEFGLCYQYKYGTEQSSIFEFPPGHFHSLQRYDPEINVDWIRMPLKEFDTILLWRPFSWHQEIRTRDSSGTVLFPSWSWGSVVGPVRFQYTYTLFNHVPVAAWAHWSLEGGNFKLLSVTTGNFVTSALHEIAHKEGMFSLECSDLARKEEIFSPSLECSPDLDDLQCDKCCEECFRHNAERPETYPQICMERKTSTFIKNYPDDDITAAKAPGRLLLLTQTARLRIEYIDHWYVNKELGENFMLWDENAQWTGMLQLSECHAMPIIQMLKDCPMTFFDFAAISICDMADCLGLLEDFYREFKFPHLALYPKEKSRAGLFGWSSGSEPDWVRFFKEVQYEGIKGYKRCRYMESPELYDLPVLNVMLLGWRGKIAYRIGLGQVWLKRWVQSNPKFSAIVLE